MKIDVIVRAVLDKEMVTGKALELVSDQYITLPDLRRKLVTRNNPSWLDELKIDQEYTLTIEEK